MLCPECRDKYVYDETFVHGHPGDFVSRGWVLKAAHIRQRDDGHT